MNEEKKYQARFIMDLIKIRNQDLKMQSAVVRSEMLVRNNAFYSYMDCLIACFLDKYDIPFEMLRELSEK